jgi:hypothetical protein
MARTPPARPDALTGVPAAPHQAAPATQVTLGETMHSKDARRPAVLALMLFLGATGCKDAVLVDLCA